MRVRRFDWGEPEALAREIREWARESAPSVDVAPIRAGVAKDGDAAVLRFETQFGSRTPEGESGALPSLRVDPDACDRALADLDPTLSEALGVAEANIRTVAEAQLGGTNNSIDLPQGHRVAIREVAVGAAGIYAPGGQASYPSSVLMGATAARVAGVARIALASPPGPEGAVNPVTLAAAALCQVDEVYAMGGAQAIFALALGTETVVPVDVIAGPGNAWVQEAKRSVYGTVGIDSIAGASELMVIAGTGARVAPIALDICAQAEHGVDSPQVLVAVGSADAGEIATEVERLAAERPSVADAPLALVAAPNAIDAIALANAFAPEHLELIGAEVEELVGNITTAGCVFTGGCGGTAFGDYAAGSNHVLPTGGAGRFSGPLSPGTFRRRMATVTIDEDAAAELAPHVDAIARAESFPVHGESATIRS